MLQGVFGGLHARPTKQLSGGSSTGKAAQAAGSDGGQKRGASWAPFVASQPKKKRKKQRSGGAVDEHAESYGFAIRAQTWAPPVVPELQRLVEERLQQRQDPALTAALFLQNVKDAHGAQPALLEALMNAGKVAQMNMIVRAAKAVAPLPHCSLLTTVLGMPAEATLEQGRSLVEAIAGAAWWPSQEHEDYFRRTARPIILEFLEEASRAVTRLREGGDAAFAIRKGEVLFDLKLERGANPGEICLSRTGSPAGSKGAGGKGSEPQERGLVSGDAVVLSPMAGIAPGETACECEVAYIEAGKVVLRRKDLKHKLFSEPPGGAFRIDKLANRLGLIRTIRAAHLLAEPERAKGEDKGDRKVPRRLMLRNRPVEAVRRALVGSGAAMVKAAESLAAADEAESLAPKASEGLNKSQREALAAASVSAVSLVQGPPGTGKTTTCVRILLQWSHSWKKPDKKTCLLATSDSNIAVDNLVEGLSGAGVRVVRLGRPEAARPEVLEHCADMVAARALGVQSIRDIPDRKKAQAAVKQAIESAQVVCCTAVGAGSGLLDEYSFARVLFDEAAQATEPATLVPICRGCRQVVLVGDHCQLPPTVTSDVAARLGLNLSMFERLARSGLKPTLLEVQHRMHPGISAFPKTQIYGGRLSDGVDGEARAPPPGFDWPNLDVPVCVVPVPGYEHSDGTSFQNVYEARDVLRVAQGLLRAGLSHKELGVVTPYAAQVKAIRKQLQSAGIPTGRDRGGVEVNSVDGYQGREKDAIIMSTVRSSAAGGLGFTADWRRANVAFTRARRGLIVVCNPATLARDRNTWLPWLQWVKEQSCHIGDLPMLPPMDAASRIGLAQLETGELKRERSRSRSPPPPWKVPGAAAAGLPIRGGQAASDSRTVMCWS